MLAEIFLRWTDSSRLCSTRYIFESHESTDRNSGRTTNCFPRIMEEPTAGVVVVYTDDKIIAGFSQKQYRQRLTAVTKGVATRPLA